MAISSQTELWFQVETDPTFSHPRIILSASTKTLMLPDWSYLQKGSLDSYLKRWLVGHEAHPHTTPVSSTVASGSGASGSGASGSGASGSGASGSGASGSGASGSSASGSGASGSSASGSGASGSGASGSSASGSSALFTRAQVLALEAVRQALRDRVRSFLHISPTATGKSLVLARGFEGEANRKSPC